MSANRRQTATKWTGLGARLKHDRYRLQVHVRDRRVRLYTMNGANWSDRYPDY
jgi:ATP-dependent DNA ligase